MSAVYSYHRYNSFFLSLFRRASLCGEAQRFISIGVTTTSPGWTIRHNAWALRISIHPKMMKNQKNINRQTPKQREKYNVASLMWCHTHQGASPGSPGPGQEGNERSTKLFFAQYRDFLFSGRDYLLYAAHAWTDSPERQGKRVKSTRRGSFKFHSPAHGT